MRQAGGVDRFVHAAGARTHKALYFGTPVIFLQDNGQAIRKLIDFQRRILLSNRSKRYCCQQQQQHGISNSVYTVHIFSGFNKKIKYGAKIRFFFLIIDKNEN
jgi:hypothetical protein